MIRDLAERAGRAFLAAFLAALAVAVPATDLSTARAALLGAFAAGVSAALSLIAGAGIVGARGSASLDPRNFGTIRSLNR